MYLASRHLPAPRALSQFPEFTPDETAERFDPEGDRRRRQALVLAGGALALYLFFTKRRK